jgi:hypothetical protein
MTAAGDKRRYRGPCAGCARSSPSSVYCRHLTAIFAERQDVRREEGGQPVSCRRRDHAKPTPPRSLACPSAAPHMSTGGTWRQSRRVSDETNIADVGSMADVPAALAGQLSPAHPLRNSVHPMRGFCRSRRTNSWNSVAVSSAFLVASASTVESGMARYVIHLQQRSTTADRRSTPA